MEEPFCTGDDDEIKPLDELTAEPDGVEDFVKELDDISGLLDDAESLPLDVLAEAWLAELEAVPWLEDVPWPEDVP